MAVLASVHVLALDAGKRASAKPSDSTALDTMLKQAKREALLEAADWFEGTQEHLLHNVFSISFIKTNLRRMAHELQS
jgi:hypothetical protein